MILFLKKIFFMKNKSSYSSDLFKNWLVLRNFIKKGMKKKGMKKKGMLEIVKGLDEYNAASETLNKQILAGLYQLSTTYKKKTQLKP